MTLRVAASLRMLSVKRAGALDALWRDNPSLDYGANQGEPCLKHIIRSGSKATT